MISVKDTKKRTITVKGVQLKDGMLVDIETGENVLSQIAEKLPENADMFDMKVDVQIPDDDSDEG